MLFNNLLCCGRLLYLRIQLVVFSNSLGVRMFVSDATEAAQYALLKKQKKQIRLIKITIKLRGSRKLSLNIIILCFRLPADQTNIQFAIYVPLLFSHSHFDCYIFCFPAMLRLQGIITKLEFKKGVF